MKNFFLVLIASISIATAYATETTTTTKDHANIEISTSAPIYWQGWVYENGGWAKYQIYVNVYRTANQCDAFYAVVTKVKKDGKETDVYAKLAVKTDNMGRYYVTYDGRNYRLRL